jgi:hypothetical protein
VKALERVIEKYPQYVSMKHLETFAESEEAKENLFGLLSELAYLQVLIVK